MPTLLFANQKGGVGKTTLAVLYANHLSQSRPECQVLLVDMDLQKSIKNLRKEDESVYDKEMFRYDVEDYFLEDQKEASHIMSVSKKMCQEDNNSVIIFDLPGTINDDTLIPILWEGDYIVCPMRYDQVTMSSTSTFMAILKRIKGKRFDKDRILFIPNNIASKEGTAKEKEARSKANDIINTHFGVVMPQIPECVEMKRLNTLINTKRQEEKLKCCFEALDNVFFSKKQ